MNTPKEALKGPPDFKKYPDVSLIVGGSFLVYFSQVVLVFAFLSFFD